MCKKIFCIVLMLCTVLNICPVSAIGASGVCGDDTEWYTSGTTLYITGKGAVESLGWEAVKESITSAVVSEGITSLPSTAFSRCRNLTSVTLPSTLKSISMNTFQYSYSLDTVTIPDGVETIEYGAFQDTDITSITIPSSVKIIDTYAFQSCSELKTVQILGNGLKEIRGSAFSACTNLESITLPYGLEYIGNSAFYYCKNLDTISIPQSVKCISGNPFGMSGCAENKAYHTGNGFYVSNCLIQLYNEGDNFGTYSVLPGTRLIVGGAISYDAGYSEYILPSSLEYISNGAFSYNEDIVSIDIPSGVKEIGSGAFLGCTNLVSVSIPDGITEIPANAFAECTKLYSVTIPDSVKTIGDEAFYKCSNLVELNIPDGVTSIGRKAYEETGYSFFETSWVDGLMYYNDCLLHASEVYLGEFNVKNGTRIIADNAFENVMFNTTAVTLPQGLEIIGSEVFKYCGISEINVPDSVTYIGDYAFQYCRYLKGIKIPDNLKYLGQGAFAGCENLFEANIPAGIGEILPETFFDCDIMTIDIPEGITSIGREAFRGCNYLVSLSLPDSLKHIGDSAFSYSGLKALIVPAGVETVGEMAFSDIPNIILPYTGERSEMWHPANATDEICTTQGRIETLKITHETKVAPKAFIKMSGNTFIDLNDGITEIGELAFAETDGLTVHIPATVTEIADNAFEDADNITLRVFEGSKALDFAKNKGIHYEITKGREEKIFVTAIQQHGKTAAGIVTDGCGNGRIIVTTMGFGFDRIMEGRHLNITQNDSYDFLFDNDEAYGVRFFRTDENLAPLTEYKYVKVKYSDFD